jgi:hypothetical protein
MTPGLCFWETNFCMVRDATLSGSLRAEAKRLQDVARGMLKTADQLDGLSMAPKRPPGWKTADDLERILGDGPKLEDELLTQLATEKMVEGNTWDHKISNGRKAITFGVDRGYLAREDGRVRWIPGVRQNRRLRQKTPAP